MATPWIPDSLGGIWIPDSNRWQDSLSCILDPKAQDPRFHKQKFSLHGAQLARCSNSGIGKKIACAIGILGFGIREYWDAHQGFQNTNSTFNESEIPQYLESRIHHIFTVQGGDI